MPRVGIADLSHFGLNGPGSGLHRLIRSRFLWKIFVSYACLFVLASMVLVWLVHTRVREILTDDVMTALRDKIVLLTPYGVEAFAPGTTAEDRNRLQERLHAFGNMAHARITLIRADGVVVAESHKESTEGIANHWQRPEVQGALQHDFASDVRHSSTIGMTMLYVAKALRDQGRVSGVVRVAVPLEDINARLKAVTSLAIIAGLVGVAVALGAGFILARRVAVPVREIVHVADALQRGDYAARVKTLPSDELGRLGDTLNRLGEELTRRIATISQERTQLKAMLTGLFEGIIAVDDNNQVMFCNRAANNLLRSPVTESAGKPLQGIAGLNELVPLVTRARSQRELVQDEMIVGSGDDAIHLETKATPFKGERTSGVIVMVHDVTDLRRLERVRQDFVANVSHELKTPLTSIKGYVETLLTGALDERDIAVRFLNKINDNVGRLVNLVQDILSLARIETHEGHINAVPVDLQAIARSVLTRHEDDFHAKNIELVQDLGAEPLVVLGDREALVQVLDNLVNNALKYTPAGGQVVVRLMKSNGRHALGRVEVVDTGIGIPKEHQERIFERFYRVDKARSRAMGGTGLGLSIVKHLVAGMNGSVGVESQVGRGSRFWVDLELS